MICMDGNSPPDPGADVVEAIKFTGGSEADGADARPYINPNLRFGLITHAKLAEKDKNNAHIGRNFYGDVEVDPNVHLAFHEFELMVNPRQPPSRPARARPPAAPRAQIPRSWLFRCRPTDFC